MMNNTFLLNISLETSGGNGEDSHLVYENSSSKTFVFGVFDGLGGRSAGFDGLKGGQIASKKASEITKKILDQYYGKLTPVVADEIQSEVCRSLKCDADEKMQKSRLSGKLAGKRLCTTIALASIMQKSEDSYDIGLTWMGDSRIYFLGVDKGLQQLTSDDLEVEKDAFQMIREDPPMSQYLTADSPVDWQIHYSSENIQEKGCILACTDGCFQYLSTPWELEMLLLQTLFESHSIREWEDKLTQKYEEIKQDDVSLLVYFLGLSDFESIKELYKNRLQVVTSLYDSHDYRLSEFDNLKKIWSSYRIDYEIRLKNSSNMCSDINTEQETDASVKNVNLQESSHEEYSKHSLSCEVSPELKDSSDALPLRKDAVVSTRRENQHCHLDDSSTINSIHPKNDGVNFHPTLQKIASLLKDAYCYTEDKSYQEAISCYKEILQVDQNHSECNYYLGRLYLYMSNFKSAASCFQRMPKSLLLDPEKDVMGMYLESLSMIGDYENVINLCQEVIQLNPNNPRFTLLIGRMLYKQDFLKDAKNYLEQSVFLYKEIIPNSWEIRRKINLDIEEIRRKLAKKQHKN